MPTTLLYIGTDQAMIGDLAFLPGDVARVDSISDARRYLLRDPDAAGTPHLIAYGLDIALRYLTPGGGRDVPLDPKAWGRPIVLLHGPRGGALDKAADRLGASHIVSLPDDWQWLLDELAGDRAERRGLR